MLDNAFSILVLQLLKNGEGAGKELNAYGLINTPYVRLLCLSDTKTSYIIINIPLKLIVVNTF